MSFDCGDELCVEQQKDLPRSPKRDIERAVDILLKEGVNFESGNDFIIYKIDSIDEKTPDLTDNQTKEEIIELISQKNKFEFNKDLIDKINNNEFNDKEFIIMGKNNIQKTTLNSIRDNNKFTIDAVKILYSLPLNSFTLINDEKNRIYLAKIKKFINKEIKKNDSELKDFIDKQNSNAKNSILKSYDLYLNDKYNVVLNQKTIERVKNFFQ